MSDLFQRLYGRTALEVTSAGVLDEQSDVGVLTGNLSVGQAQSLSVWQQIEDDISEN